MHPQQGTSEIDTIIPPEILGDEFHELITQLARTEALQHVLEIGSSAGGGSTTAFVTGLRANPASPTLYCMELSKPRFEALTKTYQHEGFVRCYNVSSVPVEEFPSDDDVRAFYRSTPTALNKYPLDRVLGWLHQDIAYVRDAEVPRNGIELIKKELGINAFDMVLIDGSEFTGSAELDHVYGAKIILLDDTNAFKCHEARRRLMNDPSYELIADNQKLRNGFSAFRLRGEDEHSADTDTSPIHFFTIVLNGEPFIRYHLDMMRKLPFRWHWHIVEGVANLVHDTAWSVNSGGRVDRSFHDRGRSNDGTSDYLDQIAAAEPGRVTLYRKPLDQFWDGKREMVSAPLRNITEPCLLWQVDADELWRDDQIRAVRKRFFRKPEATAAFFWCDYFVGPSALISTRYNYAQNPAQEWLRVWRYMPGDHWAAHEPPTLVRRKGMKEVDVAGLSPLMHGETESLGAVFQHFAYVTEEQVRFKEVYYGYADAVRHWRALQSAIATEGAVLLRNYFPWVTDDTLADSISHRHVAPIAHFEGETGKWRFDAGSETVCAPAGPVSEEPLIVVDGVFFQHNQKSGIARVWRGVLEEWLRSGFSKHIVLLDRAGTAPRLPGLRTRSIPPWDADKTAEDCMLLQKVCDEEQAGLFVSTYYTTPLTTPSSLVLHDMIPERLGIDPDDQTWHEKRYAIEHASSFICVSETTKRAFLSLFPRVEPDRAVVAPNGLEPLFSPAPAEDIAAFRAANRLAHPYFLLVGDRIGYKGYKDAATFFRAFARWPERERFEIVCVGGAPEIERELAQLVPPARVRRLNLRDEELRVAYSGATALVYPSRFEGFGLPLLEAMACGCPVVTARGSAMEEVAGEAAIYFKAGDIIGLTNALDRVLDQSARAPLIALGRERAKAFTWAATAETYARTLLSTYADLKDGRLERPSSVWRLLREEQSRNQAALSRLQKSARRRGGLGGLVATSVLREPLFRVRGVLLRRLPKDWIPAARKGWRLVMGIRTDKP